MFISKVFLFVFVCLFSVCANSVAQTENTNQTQTKEKPELSLKMERNGCYGSCPIYDLTIQSNGKIIFEGKFWTKVTGTAEDQLPEEKYNQLIAEIEKANFFLLDDNYNWDSKNCPDWLLIRQL